VAVLGHTQSVPQSVRECAPVVVDAALGGLDCGGSVCFALGHLKRCILCVPVDPLQKHQSHVDHGGFLQHHLL